MPRLEALVTADIPAAAAAAAAANGSAPPPQQQTVDAAGADAETKSMGALHPSFRLWLTSAPTQGFPAAVLQVATKAALEPPRGLRAQALRALAALPPSARGAGAPPEARRLMLAGALLHAAVLGRRRYGAAGWGRPYASADGDLAARHAALLAFLPDGAAAGGAATPASGAAQPLRPRSEGQQWRGLRFMAAEIVYGGRVTDASDRRLLAALVARHYGPSAGAGVGGAGSGGAFGGLAVPADGDAAALETALRALPPGADADPRPLGLHPNAAIAVNVAEGRRGLDAVAALPPTWLPAAGNGAGADAGTSGVDAAGGGGTLLRQARGVPSATVKGASQNSSGGTGGGDDDGQAALEARIAAVLAALPVSLSPSEASALRDPFAPLPGGGVDTLGALLRQEVDGRNALLAGVAAELAALAGALQGRRAMTAELEDAAAALRAGAAPVRWAAAGGGGVTAAARRPLATWLRGVQERVAFVRGWLRDGAPRAFWLPALLRPRMLWTAVLQNHARRRGMPFDTLALEVRVLAPEDEQEQRASGSSSSSSSSSIEEDGDGGIVICGLHLEGARWDAAAGALAEAARGANVSPLPPLRLVPVARDAALYGRDDDADDDADDGDKDGGGGVSGSSGATYSCPLYATAARADLVARLRLPAGAAGGDVWMLGGVAALCSLDD